MADLKLLDIPLALGLTACTLNAGDLLLLPSQKKRFQAAIATATLWLDYQKPLRWLPKLVNLPPTAQAAFGVTIMALSWVLMTSEAVGRTARIFGFFTFLVLGEFRVVFAPWARLAQPLVSSLVSAESIVGFLGASARLLAMTLVAYAALLVIVIPCALVSDALGYVAVISGVIILLRWRPHYAIALQVSVEAIILVTVTAGVLLLGQFVLTVGAALGYRVHDYSKGAWSAIVLIATVALGVYRLLAFGS